MEPRSKRLAKTAKLLLAASFGLIMSSVMLLAFFLDAVKHITGGSAVLLFFSALLAAFSFMYYMQYVRLQCLAAMEALRERIDEVCQTKQVGGEA
jgi:hypothetical protein